MALPPPLFYGVTGGDVNLAGNNNSDFSHSDNVKRSIIVIILILAITVLLSVSLYLFLRHLNRRCLSNLLHSPSSNFAAAASASSHRVTPDQSLTASFLDSIPLFTFSSITRSSKHGSTGDCAVCLSKFEPEDQLRLLPLCCHAFHAECIDVWLTSNQTCPLCRSPLFASDSDLKVLFQSTNAACDGNGSGSFRLEIGSISHQQTNSDSGEQRTSYSIGSFDYIVEEESQLNRNQTHRRSISDKEYVTGRVDAASEASLAAEVASDRSRLKEHVDRLSFSLSSRALLFRYSGRFFTGSGRRSNVAGGSDGYYDVEANRTGEEISEMFRWFSGV